MLASNSFYDVIIRPVRSTQSFVNIDDNVMIFSKIATFLQNWFIGKFICDLIS